jgi:hypothetical protein
MSSHALSEETARVVLSCPCEVRTCVLGLVLLEAVAVDAAISAHAALVDVHAFRGNVMLRQQVGCKNVNK